MKQEGKYELNVEDFIQNIANNSIKMTFDDFAWQSLGFKCRPHRRNLFRVLATRQELIWEDFINKEIFISSLCFSLNSLPDSFTMDFKCKVFALVVGKVISKSDSAKILKSFRFDASKGPYFQTTKEEGLASIVQNVSDYLCFNSVKLEVDEIFNRHTLKSQAVAPNVKVLTAGYKSFLEDHLDADILKESNISLKIQREISLDNQDQEFYNNLLKYVIKAGGKVKDGRGVYTDVYGSIFDGVWKNGKLNGKGTCVWMSGNRYVGNWENGKRTGQGIYKWVKGAKYQGGFKEGKRSGLGTLTYANGAVDSGIWEDDKLIGLK